MIHVIAIGFDGVFLHGNPLAQREHFAVLLPDFHPVHVRAVVTRGIIGAKMPRTGFRTFQRGAQECLGQPEYALRFPHLAEIMGIFRPHAGQDFLLELFQTPE